MRPVSLVLATALFVSLVWSGGADAQPAGLAVGLQTPATERGVTLVAHGRDHCVPAPRCGVSKVAVCMKSYRNPATRRSCCTAWACSGGPF